MCAAAAAALLLLLLFSFLFNSRQERVNTTADTPPTGPERGYDIFSCFRIAVKIITRLNLVRAYYDIEYAEKGSVVNLKMFFFLFFFYPRAHTSYGSLFARRVRSPCTYSSRKRPLAQWSFVGKGRERCGSSVWVRLESKGAESSRLPSRDKKRPNKHATAFDCARIDFDFETNFPMKFGRRLTGHRPENDFPADHKFFHSTLADDNIFSSCSQEFFFVYHFFQSVQIFQLPGQLMF